MAATALTRALLSFCLFVICALTKTCESTHSNLYFTKVEVQNCFTGSMRCTRKLVVSIEAWQGLAIGPEDVTVVIDSAKDTTSAKGETIYFQNPFGLTIHKPEPLLKFAISSRMKKKHFFDIGAAYFCKPDLLLDRKICPRDHTSPEGCCNCFIKPQNAFATPRCGAYLNCNQYFDKCTMHFMRETSEKYQILELSSPELVFDLSLIVDINGNPQASFTFDKKNRDGLTKDFSISIKTTSSLYHYDIKLNFNDYLIALPCLDHLCSQYGLDRAVWLILKKSEFTFDGNGCNKIGMSNAFFVSWLSGDEQRCYEPIESCLRNDIRGKIREQVRYKTTYQEWLYSIDKYGKPFSLVELPTPGECRCVFIPLQTSEKLSINMEINIDNIKFLKKRSLGVIETIRITPPPKTLGAKKDTIASITILNIGSTQTVFQVAMTCDIALPISKRASKYIGPQEEGVIPLYMIVPTSSKFEFMCYVTLLDGENNQLDQRMLWMSTVADQYSLKYVVGMPPSQNTLIGDNHELGNFYWSLVRICKGIAVALSKVLGTIVIHS